MYRSAARTASYNVRRKNYKIVMEMEKLDAGFAPLLSVHLIGRQDRRIMAAQRTATLIA